MTSKLPSDSSVEDKAVDGTARAPRRLSPGVIDGVFVGHFGTPQERVVIVVARSGCSFSPGMSSGNCTRDRVTVKQSSNQRYQTRLS